MSLCAETTGRNGSVGKCKVKENQEEGSKEVLDRKDAKRRETWEIRRICREQEKEAAKLAALEKRVFSDAWTERGIMETLCQDNAMALGIWKDGVFAGYVILYYVLDEGEIARIATDPSCRRQGAAGRLFERLEKICGERGIGRLLLEVRRSNEAAVAFYQKWGFTEDGIRKDYYASPREDAVLMSKWL